ncbi:MAG: ATP-binding protein, partial [Blastocatellia bacterium]|nr:ATP-binding protein [Blastocatellia bacterium]
YEAESRHVNLENLVGADLNQILADPDMVAEILDNLLSNAVRHTDYEGSIKISAKEHANYMVFSVTDTGTGIAPEDLTNIFRRFVSVGETREGGTGLGLAIVKRLVEVQGGQIGVESRLGEGTTFSFTLPLI